MTVYPVAFLLLAFSAESMGFACMPLPGSQPCSGHKAPLRQAAIGRGARCAVGLRARSVRACSLGAGPLGLDFDTQAVLLDAAFAGPGQDG